MPRSSEDAPAFFCKPRINKLQLTQPTSLKRIAASGLTLATHDKLKHIGHLKVLAFFCMLILISPSSSLKAQTATATLSGTVVDEQNAIIPGAQIMVINLAQGFQRTAQTNSDGMFVVPLLPPGRYIVKTDKEGFATLEIRDVVLNVNDEMRLNIQLKIGRLTGAKVDVLETPSLVDESTSRGATVDRQFVENLPLNGRSFQSLISLTPGVVTTKTQFIEQGQFSVNGQRTDANYYTVDGVSANIGISAASGFSQSEAGALPGLTATGGTNNLVSVDALEEFKIQTSTYAAEFGRTPGAQVQILTRSGTNDFHFSVFEYFRNDALDANDWFANRAGLRKPPLRQNDFGGVFSGPILLPRFGEAGRQPWYNGRDKTYFFFSYEGLRLRQPQTGLTTVPSLNSRQIAPNAIQPFLNAFPRPNGRDLANNFSEFNASFSNPSTLNATSIRIDHNLNSRAQLFTRYNHAPSQVTIRGGLRSLNTFITTAFKTETLTGGVTLIVTPAISNEFRANYSRNKAASISDIDSFGGATPPSDSIIFPAFASRHDSFFALSMTGGTQTGFEVGKNAINQQSQINLVDNLSIVRGSHSLKFGVDYRRLSPSFGPRIYSQQPLFAGVNGALTSRASLVTMGAFAGERFPLFTNFSLFGQDNWKIRRFSVSYGLRWEYNPPPSEKNGNNPFAVTNVDNPSLLALAPNTPLYKRRYNNFAPRLGLSYQLSKSAGRETIVKGGLGIFYDLGSGQIANSFANSFPNRALTTLFNEPFPLNAVSAAPPSFSLNPPFGSIFVADNNLKLPYTYQWNLAVEQSLGPSQTISTSYVGAAGRRLLRNEILVNPNSNFTSASVLTNGAESDYHAFQLQYQRRLTRGLQAMAFYAWSHSIDTASSDSANSTPSGTVDPKQDRAASDFDVRHAFSGAVTYNIPSADLGRVVNLILRSWSVDTIGTARTGLPVNVVTGSNLFGIFAVSRPDVIAGIPLYLEDSSVGGGRRINLAAFRVPPLGPGNVPTRQGNLGRNALRGFGMWQVDLALRRQFNLNEKLSLQFRGEFFNIFNHPNFGDPTLFGTDTMSNPSFGRSVNMLGRRLGTGGSNGGFSPLYQVGGPRSVQFALKLQF